MIPVMTGTDLFRFFRPGNIRRGRINGLNVLHQYSMRCLIRIGNYVEPELRLPRLSRAVSFTDACCLFRFALAAVARSRSDGL